jgi:hypothetical protein
VHIFNFLRYTSSGSVGVLGADGDQMKTRICDVEGLLGARLLAATTSLLLVLAYCPTMLAAGHIFIFLKT